MIRISHFFAELAHSFISFSSCRRLCGALCLTLLVAACGGGGGGGGGTQANPPPDELPARLTLGTPTVSDSGLTAGESFTITLPYSCRGSCPAVNISWYHSSDADISSSDTLLSSVSVTQSVVGFFTHTLTAPATPGTYYYGACIGSNPCSTGVEVVVSRSLTDTWSVGTPTTPDSDLNAGESFIVTLPYECSGFCAAATISWYRSPNPIISRYDILLADISLSQSTGGSFTRPLTTTAPMPPGAYYYGACLDGDSCSAGVRILSSGGTNDALSDCEDSYSTTSCAIGTLDSVDGNFSSATDVDFYEITVTQTGVLVAQTTGPTDTNGILYDREGTAIAANDNVSDANANFRIEALVFPGTYYLEVNGYSGSTGSYGLRTSFEIPTNLVPSAFTSGSISPAGDLDSYRITVTQTGVLVAQTTGATDTVGALYDSGGRLIQMNDDGGTDNNFQIEQLVFPGTYYLVVGAFDSSITGSYGLITPFIAPTAIGASDSHNGSLVAAEHDYYAITVTQPGVLTVRTTGTTDTFGVLYDSEGRLIANNDDVSNTNRNFRIDRLVFPGTYYLLVRGYSPSITGSYELSTSFAAPANLGTSASTSGIDLAGVLDSHKIMVTEAGVLGVWTTGPTDTNGTLYDSEGTVIGSNDDRNNTDTNFQIEALVFPGTYYLVVRGYSSSTSDYGLRTSFTAPPDLGTSASVSGQEILPAGDLDSYRITVTEAGILTVRTTGATDTAGILYDSEGRLIQMNDDGGADNNFQIEQLVFPGTYYLVVRGYFFDSTIGDYGLETDFTPSAGGGLGDPSSDCDFAATNASGNPLECYQWYLERIGVKEIWQQGGDGAGVHISVVDDAGQVDHEDLNANIVPGGSVDYARGSSQDDDEGAHGVAAAGIIAAVGENGVGVKGIASSGGIYFSNPLVFGTLRNFQDALSRHTSQTAVSSNSWGGDRNRLARESALTFSIIETQLMEGYGGKGVSYVFAGGNERNQSGADGSPAFTSRSDYEDRMNHYGIIPVCAVNADDEVASYSNPGTNLWICAPSGDFKSEAPDGVCRSGVASFPDTYKWGLATTDLMGDRGYNEGTSRHDFGGGGFSFNNCFYPGISGDASYTRFFDGTSAAAPVVSGVIALIRAEYPELSWRDIKLILAESAEQVDAAASSWQLGAAAYRNSSINYVHSDDYGFGLIDAAAAWALADSWTPLNQPMVQYEATASELSIGQAHSEYPITVPADVPLDFIEYVNVEMDSNYTNFGDLRIALRSPNGMESVFTRPHSCMGGGAGGAIEETEDCDDLNGGFMFGSAAHLGEDPQTNGGRWTLIIDGATHSAPLKWTLRFWGHTSGRSGG